MKINTHGLRSNGITINGLHGEFLRQDEFFRQLPERIGAFIGRSANQWMDHGKKQADAKMLLGPFWFEGEICVLLASANQGKTILAIQAGDGIGAGKPVLGFASETGPLPVGFFDFEMSVKQFERRYSTNGEKHHQWSDNFTRYELDADAEMPAGFTNFEDYLIHSIEEVVKRRGTKVIIIDNMTYLASDTETAKGAAPLMKRLKQLKSRYDLSLLILAHTPKRDASKPITQNDLQGSSRLMQFCDSCFAIGASAQGSNVKYLKQIKVRNTAFEYDAANVIVCSIQKTDSFLHFEVMGTSTEREHLKSSTGDDESMLIAQLKELAAQGNSQRMIATTMSLSPSKVNRLLNKEKVPHPE